MVTPSSSCTILEAANQIGVNPTTIRNWLKAGYLAWSAPGHISLESLQYFQEHIAGSVKLTQRANKQYKPEHDHHALQQEMVRKIQSDAATWQTLGSWYESQLSDVYKNKEGIYYTPPEIVADLFQVSGRDLSDQIFCDPCCGSGHFILRALELGFAPQNCYGLDTDPVAVALTQKRIYEQTGYMSEHIQCADFLSLPADALPPLDYVYTNPPWGKKHSAAERARYRHQYGIVGQAVDTCTLFFVAALARLRTQGEMGLLLPEAFFQVGLFEPARQKILQHHLQRLVHYGKPFKKLQTGAVGFVLTKQASQERLPKDTLMVQCQWQGQQTERTQDSFCQNPKSIFNVHCAAQEAELIRHLFTVPHQTLLGQAQWGMGIVTGNNRRYVVTEPQENYLQVYKGSDLQKGSLQASAYYIPSDLSLYQQSVPAAFFQQSEKLVYRFISSELVFYLDREQRYFLNSANMLVVHPQFPVAMSVLADLFNSDFMSWLFQKLFHTHKVLRTDLESLPIYPQFLNGKQFVEADYLNQLHIQKHGTGTYVYID